ERGNGGKDDRSSGGQGVRGGTGGRRDDQPVSFIGGHEVIVDMSIEIDHARQLRFRNDDIVQRRIASDGPALADEFAIDHATEADTVLATQRAFKIGEEVLNRDGGEEAQMTEIDGEQRNIAACYVAGRRKKCPIASQHDHEISTIDQLFPREELTIVRVLRGLLIATVGDAPLVQPLNQPTNDPGGLSHIGLGNDAYRFNVPHLRSEFLQPILTNASAGVEKKLAVSLRT